MISTKSRRLVTAKGECFDVEYHGNIPGNRDGAFHDFRLYDVVRKRGVLQLAATRSGQRDAYTSSVPEYERREDTVILNAIRRAFDRDILSFNDPIDASLRKEIALEPSDFTKQPARSDKDIKYYITHKAYLLSYRYPQQSQPAGVLHPISFDEEMDLEYLGIDAPDILRVIGRMRNQGLLDKVQDALARPTEKLLESYESPVADEREFARRAIEQARKSIPGDGRENTS
jgi:hypothetical protein